ncbi:MAG: hypothetical protein IKL63_04950 [Alistipes sp.]|nr:hypothetical protein [Alistipes sp.]
MLVADFYEADLKAYALVSLLYAGSATTAKARYLFYCKSPLSVLLQKPAIRFTARAALMTISKLIKYYLFLVVIIEFITTFAPENNVEGFGLIATTIKNC